MDSAFAAPYIHSMWLASQTESHAERNQIYSQMILRLLVEPLLPSLVPSDPHFTQSLLVMASQIKESPFTSPSLFSIALKLEDVVFDALGV